jgi:mono/diheme cytochrome c family protein
MRRFLSASVLALALLASAWSARAQQDGGDPRRGFELARGWCADCHAMEPSDTATHTGPSFQAIADQPAITEPMLRAFLRTPHARMPMDRIPPQETDDIIAYILSLRHK